jgi:hypothetical protein
MRSNTRSRLVAAALLGFVPACGGGSTEPPAACTGPVTVSVSGGTTPTISWTPDCGLGYLTVHRPLPPSLGFVGVEPLWTIRADGPLIGPSVRYGVRPRAATEVVAPRQLVAGQSYSVVVDFSGQGVLGSRTFTP